MSTGRYSYGTSLCYWSDVQYSQKVLTHQVTAKPWFCRLQQMRFGRRVTAPCCGNAAVDRWVITFWWYCILWCFNFSLSANSRTFQGLYQKFKYCHVQGFLKNEGLSKTTSKIQGCVDHVFGSYGWVKQDKTVIRLLAILLGKLERINTGSWIR